MLRIRYKIQEHFICAFKCGEDKVDTDDFVLAAGAEILIITSEHIIAVTRENSPWEHKIDLQWRICDFSKDPKFEPSYGLR